METVGLICLCLVLGLLLGILGATAWFVSTFWDLWG